MAEVGKPTKPGFYWYRGDDSDSGWEPVEVYQSSRLGLIVFWIGIEGDATLSTVTGEWGPEIVRPE